MKTTTAFRCSILVIPIAWMIVGLISAEQHSYGNVHLVASQTQEPSPQQKHDRIAIMTDREKEAFDKFVKHESRFKDHYQAHFSTSHYEYNQYRPAYQHGFELGLDPRFRKMDWSNVEPEARRTWDESTMGIWSQYKDAVRYGWEQGVALERG
jgi:hypothetical protein